MGKLVSIWLIESFVLVYDIITLPLYYMIQQPWKSRKSAQQVRAKKVETKRDSIEWLNVDNKLDKSNRKQIFTLDELFRDSVSTYAQRKCLGVRKILGVEYKDAQVNGILKQNDVSDKVPLVPKKKVISKYILDDKYTWYTYKQIEQMVIKLSAGLVSICNTSLENSDGSRKVLICADTCMQWFLMAHACFRNNVIVVTAYTSLDDDAILHTLHETEVKILVVCQKFVPRLSKIVKSAPHIDTIIILDEPLPSERDQRESLENLLPTTNISRVISYNDLLIRGGEIKESNSNTPSADDVAVLMYTSGSTGKAKGVMLTHKSIVYTALSFSGPGDISNKDRYIGYLPLGHVLELAAECIFIRNGCSIAYSSPLTLTSRSPLIKSGQHGDAYIFKPTIMGAVPLVLDRIKNTIQQAVKKEGAFYDQLINDFVIRYKRYWWERHYDTPIMNFLICRRFRMVLGGQIRAICSGGAALSKETQEYLRHVTNFNVLQGYGLTETSAAASFCDLSDRRYNVVGPPYPIVRLRLESWSDYSVHDKPHPRGEIIVGGQPVAAGYYKLEELTKESFFEENGVRYFRTGDVGMMLPDGVLKIIDRKKDIVKPLSGEYISLSEIEAAMKNASVVENVCVYCSQYSNYVVALVKPDFQILKMEAHQLAQGDDPIGVKFRRSIEKAYEAQVGILATSKTVRLKEIITELNHDTLCSNQYLVAHILKLLQEEGNKQKLKRTQIPSRIKIVTEDWSPETGFVTASFKLRRREIERHYADSIKQLYAELGQTVDN